MVLRRRPGVLITPLGVPLPSAYVACLTIQAKGPAFYKEVVHFLMALLDNEFEKDAKQPIRRRTKGISMSALMELVIPIADRLRSIRGKVKELTHVVRPPTHSPLVLH